MYGSAMNLIGTGMLYSHARSDLSSEVVILGHVSFVLLHLKRKEIGGNLQSSVFIAESNRIDGSKMMIIFLSEFTGAYVVLDNLFVRHASNKLIVIFWVIPDDMRRLPRGKFGFARARFRVEDLHVAVVGGCEEFSSIVVPGHIVAGFRVS
jgi:hypothetical protein